MAPIVLLLGKNGQIGAALHRALRPHVRLAAHDRGTCDLADIRQVRGVIADTRPDLIVNAAAYTDVDGAEREQALCGSINADAPAVIAEEARRLGACVVHYSSGYVFDGRKSAAYGEDDVPNPLGAYGRSKLRGDLAVLAADRANVVVRVNWIHAPRGHGFAQSILRLAAERDELRVVDDQFGTPTSARFVAEVTMRIVADRLAPAAREGAAAPGGLIHVAPGGSCSWHGYATEVIRQARRSGIALRTAEHRIVPIAAAEFATVAPRPRNSVLDTARLESRFAPVLPDWRADLAHVAAALDR